MSSIAAPRSMGGDGLPLIDYDARIWYGAVDGNVYDTGGMVHNALAPQYGIKGDGTAEDMGKVNGLIGLGGVTFFPTATYLFPTPIAGVFGMALIGTHHWATSGTIVGTQFKGTAGQNIINLLDTAAAFTHQGALIQGIVLIGGVDQLYAPNGGVGVTLRDLTLQGPSHAGIYWKGFIQEWFVYDVYCNGGAYGFFFNSEPGTVSPVLFDKNFFSNIYCVSQTVNGILIEVDTGTGTNTVWYHLRLITIQQDGMVIGGNLNEWTFINFQTERNGQADFGVLADTTGTGAAGAPNLTVASGVGFANGQQVTVAGAAAGGTDLVSTIASGGGTVNLVLNDNLVQAVAAVEVTTRRYTNLRTVVTPDTNIPSNLTFINWGDTGTALVVYAADFHRAKRVKMWGGGTNGTRPIYDPASAVEGSRALVIRRPALIASVNADSVTLLAGGAFYQYTLTADVTLTAPPSPIGGTGQELLLGFTQDGVGGHKVTMPANITAGGWQPGASIGDSSLLALIYDGANYQPVAGWNQGTQGPMVANNKYFRGQRTDGTVALLLGVDAANQTELRATASGKILFQAVNAGSTMLTLLANASLAAEDIFFKINARTLTLTGSYATERFYRVEAPTATGAFTLTDTATLAIQGAPIAAGGATLTRKYGLWHEGVDPMRYDATTGIGNAAAANVQSPGLGTGGGPANPLLVQAWKPIYDGTTLKYMPLFA